jgi:hypothetical protein
MKADLHIHTYYSDGAMSPKDVVCEAKKNGVDIIAVTDHDTVKSFPYVKAECIKSGVHLVRGIEVSAYVDDLKVHTLGYNVDEDNPVFKKFTKKLYDGSMNRLEDIIKKLNSNHVFLTVDEVLAERADPAIPVHASHISSAGFKKGYSLRLWDFFSHFLAYGKCAFSNVDRPTPEETVEVINSCGGFTSIAHPGRIDRDRDGQEKLIKKMVDAGLRGIEAVYSTHTEEETEYYKELSAKFNLVVTGGSDTHFIGGRKAIGSPTFTPDEKLMQLLKFEN